MKRSIYGKIITRGSNPKRKLTESQVRDILADRDSTLISLALKYGVSDVTISKIRRGQTWRGVTA